MQAHPSSQRASVNPASEAHHRYHVERARAELDLSYRAVSIAAAAAHMRLAALHIDRMLHGEAAQMTAKPSAASFPRFGH